MRASPRKTAGAVDGRGGVLAEVVAEPPGLQGLAEPAGDLGEQLRQAGGGQGQGADDVVGVGGLAQPGLAAGGLVQAADRLGGGAGQAQRVVAGGLVQSMTCRKSSTAASSPAPARPAPASPGRVGRRRARRRAGGGMRALVVHRALFLLAFMLLADQGDVVDAGGAGGLIAADRGFRAGLGVGVPGDVVRGRGPGVLAAAPDRTGRSGRTGRRPAPRAGRRAPGRPGTGCRAWRPGPSWTRSAIRTSGTPQPGPAGPGAGNGPPASHRASGGCPVSECSRTW